MAFNFKWSPLAADTSFYTRARELLTTALNKSPKPPIIVDDIVVNELNLGEIPPDLEVLEVGDLDVDRFRGIFKMCYSGNAYLTLKTRVQANPLNTYLSTTPSFTSPQPLAAASGLTIPIQITLSEIKLSAFIILVYSSQKGITLVFRNDPLESLKVSSTFDAIPFVRDYLQKEIEVQLRTLLMDELPLIIHRLSLRFFSKEYQEKDNAGRLESGSEEKPVDPFSSPPQDPVDVSGNVLDVSQIPSLSLDPGSETHALFSRRNLLRLGVLNQSHRTLSLFTPTLSDTIFRASSGALERKETRFNTNSRPTPALSRSQSYAGSLNTRHNLSSPTSPSFSPSTSAAPTLLSRHTKPPGRRRKHRVINLRKKAVDSAAGDDSVSVSGSSTTNSAGGTESAESAPPEISLRPSTPEMIEPGDADVGQTPPRLRNVTPRQPRREAVSVPDDETPRQSQYLPRAQESGAPTPASDITGAPSLRRPSAQRSHTAHPAAIPSIAPPKHTSSTEKKARPEKEPLTLLAPAPSIGTSSSQSPFEHEGWMNRIADEILRKVHERKAEDSGFWDRPRHERRMDFGDEGEREPPPAYGA